MTPLHPNQRITVQTPAVGAAALLGAHGTVQTVIDDGSAVVRLDAPVPERLRSDPRDSHVTILFADELAVEAPNAR